MKTLRKVYNKLNVTLFETLAEQSLLQDPIEILKIVVAGSWILLVESIVTYVTFVWLFMSTCHLNYQLSVASGPMCTT